ncbi:DUF3267 domain-containing protein [candidate division WOR-3 bacterium]|nr:DUF3267 domain-containing protein [candidate division WOR-3 bacterium]
MKTTRVRCNPYLLSLTAIIVGLGCWVAFYRVYGDKLTNMFVEAGNTLNVWHVVGGIIFIIATVPIHELLHVVIACRFVSLSDVHIKPGILAWQCRVDKPLSRKQFILYALFPCMVLSGGGLVSFFVVGSPYVKLLSVLLCIIGIAGATGDVWFTIQVMRLPHNVRIIDEGIELRIVGSEGE